MTQTIVSSFLVEYRLRGKWYVLMPYSLEVEAVQAAHDLKAHKSCPVRITKRVVDESVILQLA